MGQTCGTNGNSMHKVQDFQICAYMYEHSYHTVAYFSQLKVGHNFQRLIWGGFPFTNSLNLFAYYMLCCWIREVLNCDAYTVNQTKFYCIVHAKIMQSRLTNAHNIIFEEIGIIDALLVRTLTFPLRNGTILINCDIPVLHYALSKQKFMVIFRELIFGWKLQLNTWTTVHKAVFPLYGIRLS